MSTNVILTVAGLSDGQGGNTTIINNIINNNNYYATGNQIISGGGVVWIQNYDYTVSAAVYQIQGTTYTSPQTNLTLAASDPSLDRIDLIVLDTAGVATVITGTPAAQPAAPAYDPMTQVFDSFIYVAAGSSAPTITNENIYLDNTEWTGSTSTGRIVLASTNNPYQGTVDIEATAAITGDNFTYVKPAAGTITLDAYNTLVLYMRSKAAWPAGKTLTFQLYNGAVPQGVPVVMTGTNFGFNSSVTGVYQQVVIPTSLFNAAGIPISTIRVTVGGGNVANSIGFYLDDWFWQPGVAQPQMAAPMIFRGVWNATVSYLTNDVVVTGTGASRVSYVALNNNTAQNPATATTTWQPLSATGAGTGTVTNVGGTGGVQTDQAAGAAITTAGNLRAATLINAQTGTTYTFLTGDRGKHVTFSNSASIAVTLPQATIASGNFPDGWFVIVENIGVGAVTITPTTSTINGAATFVMPSGTAGIIYSDGTNYRIVTFAQAAGIAVNAQTGTSYTVLSGDLNKLITFSNTSAIAVTLPQATGAFGSGWFTRVFNKNNGAVTITPTTSTINGATTLVLQRGQGATIVSDGTNYQVQMDAAYPMVPVTSKSAAYTTVLADANTCLYHPASDANARTFTIDSNANVPYPIGTCLTFANLSANTLSIAITADTMYLDGLGTTGTRSLAQYGKCTALKVDTTTWMIGGTGLT